MGYSVLASGATITFTSCGEWRSEDNLGYDYLPTDKRPKQTRPDITVVLKGTQECTLIYIAVSTDQNIFITEEETVERYQNLALKITLKESKEASGSNTHRDWCTWKQMTGMGGLVCLTYLEVHSCQPSLVLLISCGKC